MARVHQVEHGKHFTYIESILQRRFGQRGCDGWLWVTVISSGKPQFAFRATPHIFSHSDPWVCSLIYPRATQALWEPQLAAAQRAILAQTHLFQSPPAAVYSFGTKVESFTSALLLGCQHGVALQPDPKQQDAARCNHDASHNHGHP